MTRDLDRLNVDLVSIVQTMLHEDAQQGALDEEQIASKVEFVANALYTGKNVDRRAVTEELVRRFRLWIGDVSTLVDNRGHKDWLTGGRKKGWRYWRRYDLYLRKRLSSLAVDGLDEATDRILALLEDPGREGVWDRRGLVVGHVQSGKTANYTGLICKAADAGYRIIIVLAGTHNNLRSQTQIRLEEGFLGYETSDRNGVAGYIGVGEHGADSDINPNCATNRSDDGDFNTRVAKHLAISPEQRPWLFVVKKNKTVLDRLLKWIHNHVADSRDSDGHPLVSGFPLLLVDDEADHASVDTGDQEVGTDGKVLDEEYQPTVINSRIRRILHTFSRKVYVGYTATPFANVFIDRRKETRREGPDLFPRSFIINLPAPSDYGGPVQVFGLKTPEGRQGGLPLVRQISEREVSAGQGGWMPARHTRRHIPQFEKRDELPPSLREAIAVFALCCAVRVLRGQGGRHCSMLIHVTRFTDVQNHVYRQVGLLVRYYRACLRGIGKMERDALLKVWKQLWDDDIVLTSGRMADLSGEGRACFQLPSWENVVEVLPEVMEDLVNGVRVINGTAGDVLDYEEHQRTGLKVIAIGGDKLSRGLTLEGLCVSYFVRSAKMYDTLMQMGRWFGYRPGYLDLCRLYTTPDLAEWFGHIADAGEELRGEFDAMARMHATPENYGLKIQSHPVLMVTSPLKMRSAETLQLSFSGSLLETVAFHRDDCILRRNFAAMERLLLAAGAPAEGPDVVRQRAGGTQRWNAWVWRDVSWKFVVEFFSGYDTHPSAHKVNSAVLAEFVGAMAENGELTSWTVAVIGGGDGAQGAGCVLCEQYRLEHMVIRHDSGGAEGRADCAGHYSIARLLSPRDETLDLDASAWEAALRLTQSSWIRDPARSACDSGREPPGAPSGVSVREVRGLGADGVGAHPERGLLLLFPIDPKGAGCPAGFLPVTGFGVSFPASRSALRVSYRVDHLLWDTEYAQSH